MFFLCSGLYLNATVFCLVDKVPKDKEGHCSQEKRVLSSQPPKLLQSFLTSLLAAVGWLPVRNTAGREARGVHWIETKARGWSRETVPDQPAQVLILRICITLCVSFAAQKDLYR